MKWHWVVGLFFMAMAVRMGYGGGVAKQRPYPDLGWSDEFTEPERWEEDFSLAEKQATLRSFGLKDGHGKFQVDEPGHAARWRETTEPVWASEYKIFEMRYRAKGLAARSGAVVMLRPGSVGPVTPGASNPENPLAKGSNLSAVKADELVQDGAWHLVVKDLSTQLATPQIDQIIVTVAADAWGPASLEVEFIRFRSSDPGRALADFLPIAPVASPLCSVPGCTPEAFRLLDLHALANLPPSDALPALGINAPWLDGKWFTFAGLPFANGGVAATSVQGRETLTVPIGELASEIYLLLGASFAGIGDTPGAADAAGVDTGKTIIQTLREPERFAVDVEYSDGAVDEYFPFNLLRRAFLIENRSLGLYLLTTDPCRPIARLTLRDRMSNGAFLLFGVTINTRQSLYPRVEWTGPGIPMGAPARELPPSPPEVRREGELLVLENSYYQFEFSTGGSFRLMRALNKYSGADMLAGGGPGGLFSCGIAEVTRELPRSNTMHMEDFRLKGVEVGGKQVTVSLASPDAALPLQVRLTLRVDDSASLRAGLTVENTGTAPLRVDLTFPELRAVRLGQAQDTYYLFPRGAAVLSNADQKIEAPYSDEAPIQFLDVFNPRQDAGWGVIVEDDGLHAKVFSLEKRGERTSLAVSYSYPVSGPGNYLQGIRLAPGQNFRAPPTELLVHRGDWRPAFQAYRDWTKTWYRPLPRKEWFARVFNMRRDYPIGGTGKLFDIFGNQYTLDKLISEGEKIGGVDMIDISGWAYSPRYGRVGEYSGFSLGGLDNFRQGIAQAQATGVPVGLYTEGYLVDLNSLIGEQHGKEWQMVDRAGTPRAWPGASSEVFECPYAKGWQAFMAGTAARVLADTGAKAFYLDEYGFSEPEKACYCATHGHFPGATPAEGERQMMVKVRAAMDTVDRQAALYIEEAPPDLNAPLVDGAFCYALNFADEETSPGKINLYRFLFPHLKLFDMVSAGINPTSMTAADMKLSFLNGNGLWLKGDLDSWYSPEVKAFIVRAHRALREHSEAFTAGNVEPLVPTLAPGILANRFSSERETVYTFYNRGFRTFRGNVLAIAPELDGREFVDLLTGKVLTLVHQGGHWFVNVELGPRDVGGIAAVVRR